uniref:Uncharacterized protein n=1 Tax=Graphocephala atropunctata TaxID=36148 RepID=A0A1B6L085_9HEMI
MILHTKLIAARGGTDKDDDTHSVTSLDPKAREWMVKAAQSDYQALFKLASENPKLAKFKDPFSGYTALHWAAKHGNVDVVKLIAGTHKIDVNCRTHGGYTALHLAMQYGHEEIFNLLKDVYGATPTLRDWSGRKPHQYQTNKDTVSADTFRSEYSGSVNSLTEWYRQNYGTIERRAVVVAPPTVVTSPATLPKRNKHKQPKVRKTAIGLFT